MNKALFISYNEESVVGIRSAIEDFVPASRRLVLSERGNYRPVKRNIEKAISWLRCSKCDSQGLLRCNHGFNHEANVTLYLVIDLPCNEKEMISSDLKYISLDYLFSNLFYALPKNVKLWGILNNNIENLEFKLERTINDTFKLTKRNSIPINGDVTILSLKDINDFQYESSIADVLNDSSYIIFSGAFYINNAFLSPIKA